MLGRRPGVTACAGGSVEVEAALAGEAQREALDFMEKLLVCGHAHRVEGSLGRLGRLSCSASMADTLIRGVVRGVTGVVGARVVAAVTTGVVAEARRRHDLHEAGTIALGRAATGALLFATLSKSVEERVTLQVLGDGPLGSVTVDADGAGAVRGFVRNPQVALDAGPRRPSLRKIIGSGLVAVIRDLGRGTMYRGSTEIAAGEIDEDLEAYLAKSEQVESALGCDVL